MSAPATDPIVDCRHDLGLEIESEVVARSVIGQPARTDPDAPTVDLVDDRVVHGTLRDEPGEFRQTAGAADVSSRSRWRLRCHVAPSLGAATAFAAVRFGRVPALLRRPAGSRLATLRWPFA